MSFQSLLTYIYTHTAYLLTGAVRTMTVPNATFSILLRARLIPGVRALTPSRLHVQVGRCRRSICVGEAAAPPPRVPAEPTVGRRLRPWEQAQALQ